MSTHLRISFTDQHLSPSLSPSVSVSHTLTLTKHSRELSVTTLSDSLPNVCHDVIVQRGRCQDSGMIYSFIIKI